MQAASPEIVAAWFVAKSAAVDRSFVGGAAAPQRSSVRVGSLVFQSMVSALSVVEPAETLVTRGGVQSIDAVASAVRAVGAASS